MTLTQKDLMSAGAFAVQDIRENNYLLCVRAYRIADELEPLLKLNSRTDIRLDLKAIINTLRGEK